MKQYKYKVKGVEYEVNITSVEGNMAKVEVNGVPFDVEMTGSTSLTTSSLNSPISAPAAPAISAPAPVASAPVAPTPAASAPIAAPGSGKALKAPLPGVIISVNATVGQAVKKGQTVVVLEAMKMENNINAECDGTITSICVNKGDSVMEGTVLLTIG